MNRPLSGATVDAKNCAVLPSRDTMYLPKFQPGSSPVFVPSIANTSACPSPVFTRHFSNTGKVTL